MEERIPQITVNGKAYRLARLDELNLDEAIVVWDYTGMSLDQLPELDGFHPGVIAALIHISVARGEPDERATTIRKVVGKLPVAELQAVFAEFSEEVDDTVPPLPELDGESSPTGSSSNSGGPSSPTSEPVPGGIRPSSTGSRGSDDGSRSDRVTSAA